MKEVCARPTGGGNSRLDEFGGCGWGCGGREEWEG